jgi:PAS domain S-box-containing protein
VSSRACLTPARPRIALALANPADRRLLAAFLREGDVEVLLPEGPIRADALRGASLVIVDEAMARRARTTLLGLRREAGPLYLPLLVAVPSGSPGSPWLRAGFDDVLRLPLAKNELSARLEVFLRLRRHSENAQRDSEDRFLATFDVAPVGMAHLARDGSVLVANRRFHELLRCNENELTRLRFGDIVQRSGRRAVARAARALLRAATPVTEIVDIELSRRGAQPFWAHVTARLVRDAAGEPRRFIVALEDITERKKAEHATVLTNVLLEHRVRERTAQLAQANRELEAFNYSLSHDLRAPLRAIEAFSAKMLARAGGELDRLSRDCLVRIQRAGERMGQLIDAMMDLGVLSRRDVADEEVAVSTLARQVADELEAAHPDRDLEFVIEPGLVCRGDRALLRALLENLLGNAVKYTAKRPRARVEVGMTTTKSGMAYFVRDNGAGFDMQHAALLFQPFRRLHPEREFPGTGIGLATVQRIAACHGGSVWATGAVDQGATFFVELATARLPSEWSASAGLLEGESTQRGAPAPHLAPSRATLKLVS